MTENSKNLSNFHLPAPSDLSELIHSNQHPQYASSIPPSPANNPGHITAFLSSSFPPNDAETALFSVKHCHYCPFPQHVLLFFVALTLLFFLCVCFLFFGCCVSTQLWLSQPLGCVFLFSVIFHTLRVFRTLRHAAAAWTPPCPCGLLSQGQTPWIPHQLAKPR